MRFIVLALCILLSGCAQSSEPVQDAPIEEATTTPLPDDIRATGSMQRIHAAVVGLCSDVCAADQKFTIPSGDDVDVEMTLQSIQGTLTDPTGVTGLESDYDLHLLDASGRQMESSLEFGATPDVIRATLPPGDYIARVVVFHDVDGSFELDIVFRQAT